MTIHLMSQLVQETQWIRLTIRLAALPLLLSLHPYFISVRDFVLFSVQLMQAVNGSASLITALTFFFKTF